MTKLKLLIIFSFLIINSSFATINKTVLKNGLTIITKQNKESLIVAMDVFINVGSYYENEKEAGLTYFIQKLLLKGTKKMTQDKIAYQIDSTGSILDVGVDKDFAHIYFVCTKSVFDKSLNLLVDILFNPKFDEKEIEKVRKELLEEIDAQQDDLFEFAYEVLLENLYKGHPYHKPIRGYKETIEKFTKQDIIEFYKKYYVPNNMIVVLVSALDHNEVVKKLKLKFEKYKSKEIKKEIIKKEIRLTKTEEIIKKRDIKGAWLMVAFPTGEATSRDYPILKLINSILGEGASSRLFLTLREKESLCYQIGSFYPTRKQISHFVIYMITSPEKLELAKSGILWEIAKIKHMDIEDEELEKVKKYLIGNFLIDHEDSKSQAFYLGFYETIGLGYEYDELFPQIIRRITAEDIKYVANKYFNDYLFVAIKP